MAIRESTLEGMGVNNNTLNRYIGKRILITGHTGFKGSWLSLWLSQLGAQLFGYSLPPDDESHYQIAGIQSIFNGELFADIRSKESLTRVLSEFQPDVIFHLAAQPLVRYGYIHPAETFNVNIMGTVSLLEAIREIGFPVEVIIVTSDKCYSVDGANSGFCEGDRLGGIDPYSASKAAVEIVCDSYRQSYFPPERLADHQIALATVRAGNVIGGGDFAPDRIIPDIFRSIVANNAVILRNPQATRPWQHVLEPLFGYLLLAQVMLETHNPVFCSAFNFGPEESDTSTVREVVDLFLSIWPQTCSVPVVHPQELHETCVLKLNAKKSRDLLGWKPVWNTSQAIEKTAMWYHDYYCGGIMGPSRSVADIERYRELIS